jgi:hypothetical protein
MPETRTFEGIGATSPPHYVSGKILVRTVLVHQVLSPDMTVPANNFSPGIIIKAASISAAAIPSNSFIPKPSLLLNINRAFRYII